MPPPIPDFTTLSTPARREPGRFAADVPPGWAMGRGAFGGLVLAYLVRAIEAFAADRPGPRRPLRSLTAALCGPTAPGPADIAVEALRVGNNVSTVAARLTQGGEVQAHAVAVLGSERPVDLRFSDRPPPRAPDWRDVAPVPADLSFAPQFASHLEFRLTGSLPFTQGLEATSAGWVRFREPGAGRDAAWVVALADAFWPSLFSRLSEPRPLSTLASTSELLVDPATLDPRRPLLHVGSTPACAEGYFVEFRELWTEGGELVALNQQTFAVIK